MCEPSDNETEEKPWTISLEEEYWEMRGRKRKKSERKSSAEKDCRMSSIKINVSGTVCSSVLRDYISLLSCDLIQQVLQSLLLLVNDLSYLTIIVISVHQVSISSIAPFCVFSYREWSRVNHNCFQTF